MAQAGSGRPKACLRDANTSIELHQQKVSCIDEALRHSPGRWALLLLQSPHQSDYWK